MGVANREGGDLTLRLGLGTRRLARFARKSGTRPAVFGYCRGGEEQGVYGQLMSALVGVGLIRWEGLGFRLGREAAVHSE